MLTMRENALAIMAGEQPDYYLDIMDAVAMCPDPILGVDMCPPDGKVHKDSWGVSKCFRPGEPGEVPMNSEPSLKVIPDIERWRDSLTVPSLDGLDWSVARSVAQSTDRAEKFVCYFSATGIFERAHFLMGMEDALCSFLEEPDEMGELLDVITQYKIDSIYRAAEELEPDVIFYQDDWGSKKSLFVSPEVWRSLIKPRQRRIAEAIHDCGMVYIHHADCHCAPIAQDMVDIGVDIWQGVIPENPICEIQEATRASGKQLVMQGGIDTPRYDAPSATEESIRAGVREEMDRYLAGGKFFMGCPGGCAFDPQKDAWLKDELRRYGRRYAVEHPIGGALASDDFDMETMESWYVAPREIVPGDASR